MKSAQQLLACSLVFLPVANSYAEDSEANKFNLGVSADYSSTDNAKRVSEESAQLKERQVVYSANMDAVYKNEWTRLNSSYELRRETFQHDSQVSANEFEGQTELSLGNDYQPFNLLVSHARIVMLNSPDAIDLTQNRDTQEIITVSPSARAHFTPADSAVLMGIYNHVSYKEDEQKKSEQKGAQLAWIHGFSKTDSLQLTAQYLNTEFEYVPDANYDLQGAALQYDVNLKHLSYSIQAGYNSAKIDTSEDDFSSPTYKVESSYTSGAHTFSFTLSQEITNSSKGMGMGGGSGLFGGGATGAPSKGVGLDLINVRSASLYWNSSALCERCTFSLGASQSRQDYKELLEDGDEYGVYASFNYNFTRATSINVSASHLERDFSNGVNRSGFTNKDAKIELRHSFTEDLKLSVYMDHERRTSALAIQNYQENIVGLNLSYRFF